MEEKLGDQHLGGGVLVAPAATTTTTVAAAAVLEAATTVREACSSKWKGLTTFTAAAKVEGL